MCARPSGTAHTNHWSRPLTADPTPEDQADFAAVRREVAEYAALRALVADCVFILAHVDPVAVSRLRDSARHLRTGAELGLLEAPDPAMCLTSFHRERAALLEWGCFNAGMGHKSADVVAFDPRPTARRQSVGPGQVIPLNRYP